MHFGQEASESQIEGFEDADVGSQVVSESHGCGRMVRSTVLVVAAVVWVDVRGL